MAWLRHTRRPAEPVHRGGPVARTGLVSAAQFQAAPLASPPQDFNPLSSTCSNPDLNSNWNGDNQGPSTAVQYAADWARIAQWYPIASIYASPLDNFTQHLRGQVVQRMPVVKQEMGDTWVYGVPSDPQKVSRMRVINRAWASVAAAEPGGAIATALQRDAVLRNATRFALKLGEHTWGRDVKSNLRDNYDWTNANFERARTPGSANASQYARLEASWWEQREWGIAIAADTLAHAGHPLARSLEKGFAALEPRVPDVSGLEEGAAGVVYRCGATRLAFDTTGAVAHLSDGQYDWADAEHPLLQLKYRSYSAADVEAFLDSYCQSNESWVGHDCALMPLDHARSLASLHLVVLYPFR